MLQEVQELGDAVLKKIVYMVSLVVVGSRFYGHFLHAAVCIFAII